jgi:alpha-tubulin suppressor-like RCC1 family protein
MDCGAVGENRRMNGFTRALLSCLVLVCSLALVSSASANSGARPEIAAGNAHTCALDDTGTLRCWGANAAGQLGNGLTTDTTVPTPIAEVVVAALGGEPPAAPKLGKIDAVATAAVSTCAISESRIWCWGGNSNGELGLGTVDGDPHALPQLIPGSKDFNKITAGPTHFCASTWQGDLSCWGSNASGQIGNGSVGGTVPSPTVVAGQKKFKSIAAGGGFTCVVNYATHKPSCWGDGDGTPREIAGVEDAFEIVAGATSVCSKGWTEVAINCWPGGAAGAPSSVVGLSHPEAFGGTWNSNCVLAKTLVAASEKPTASKVRSLQCWGDNSTGQLGTGDNTSSDTPRLVSLADVATLSAGAAATSQCAIVRGGDAYCWGAGVLVPTKVEGLDLITKPQYPDWASVKPLSKPRWNKRRTAKRLRAEIVIQPSPFVFTAQACTGRVVGSVMLAVKKPDKGKKAAAAAVTYKRVGNRTNSRIYRSTEQCKAKLTFSIPRSQYKRNRKKLLLKASASGNTSMAAFSAELALKDVNKHLK